MNAKESSQNVSLHLKRIRTMSRLLKLLLLAYLILFGFRLPFVRKMPDGGYQVVSVDTYARFFDAPIFSIIIVALGVALILVAVIFCYRLLSLYEKGVIFSAKNVSLLCRIGYVAVAYGFLVPCGRTLLLAWDSYLHAAWRIGVILWYFLTYVVHSPWVMGGIFMIVVSHIMDEGRKIQEEQELTI